MKNNFKKEKKNKKSFISKVLFSLNLLSIMLFVGVTANASSSPPEVALELGQNTASITTNKTLQVAPLTKNGTVIVPLRCMAESLGFRVIRNEKERTMQVGDVTLAVGFDFIRVEEKGYVDVSVAPFIKDGSIVVPAELFQYLGFQIVQSDTNIRIKESAETVKRRELEKEKERKIEEERERERIEIQKERERIERKKEKEREEEVRKEKERIEERKKEKERIREINRNLDKIQEFIVQGKHNQPKDPNFQIEQKEIDMFLLVNESRAENGEEPLMLNLKLTEIARIKSEDMASNDYFAHQSPTLGNPHDMIRNHLTNLNIQRTGENLAMRDGWVFSASDAQSNLMNSDGHRENILRPEYEEIGIGFARLPQEGRRNSYYTQLFARQHSQ